MDLIGRDALMRLAVVRRGPRQVPGRPVGRLPGSRGEEDPMRACVERAGAVRRGGGGISVVAPGGIDRPRTRREKACRGMWEGHTVPVISGV